LAAVRNTRAQFFRRPRAQHCGKTEDERGYRGLRLEQREREKHKLTASAYTMEAETILAPYGPANLAYSLLTMAGLLSLVAVTVVIVISAERLEKEVANAILTMQHMCHVTRGSFLGPAY
jgi:hypothetical protein